MSFTTDHKRILELLDSIEPEEYAKTRNHLHGKVTRISPYISRGVISTKQVLKHLMDKGYSTYQSGKLIQELAWRDYWQLVWKIKKDEINSDLRRVQTPVNHYFTPSAISEAKTGIQSIDAAIKELYKTGYMHNHLRMYTAAVTCNVAYAHWKNPAKWMYYYLLDADWASNALSWQWVAGANANKKYIANQENINFYTTTKQKGTFLDVDYEAFKYPSYDANPKLTSTPTASDFQTPKALLESKKFSLTTKLPEVPNISINSNLPTYIYNWYNLDPEWSKEISANRILLIEPSVFKVYPISEKSMKFMLDLSKNMQNIQVFVGEFSELKLKLELSEIHFKEHPLNKYTGTEHARDWMFETHDYFKSFFAFWKKCKKELRASET